MIIMDKNSKFFKQADLMLQVMPFVSQEKCFALKGGTAINFFLRDMPRLSVDIDLVYLLMEDRETALKNIGSALERIAKILRADGRRFAVKEKIVTGGRISKLFVSHETEIVTIEPNEVIRGSVFGATERSTSKRVEEEFEISIKLSVLSPADIYGSKICAALDRQHPRDIYDMKVLLENEGVTNEIREAFVIYLASHDRPMHELLNPILKDIEEVYHKAFSGMTVDPVSYEMLLDVRKKYITQIQEALTENEKEFLISVKMGEPDWTLMRHENINKLPALQWKLKNIRILKSKNPKKHEELLSKLKNILYD